MAYEFLSYCRFTGPALPEPFVKSDLEEELRKKKLLQKTTGEEGKELKYAWEAYRRKLRGLISRGGSLRVINHVFEPLVSLRLLGYDSIEADASVPTRLEPKKGENGGSILRTRDGGPHLRVWATNLDEDMDAPARRGAAYRYSHLRIAQRVLLAKNERIGLLTNGVELRILISDPARPDSEISIPIDPDWRRSRHIPDSFILLLALCRPEGVEAIPDLVEKARLKQTGVTKELRVQARQGVERFVQEVLDHPENQGKLAAVIDRSKLAHDLWHEGLVIIYRLLFILKGEASDDPARSFRFASTSLWRNTYSPSVALAPFARAVLDEGAETGGLLESGLRALFRMFEEGIVCSELHVSPLGGALFGKDAAPLLSEFRWGERAVAHVLDRLLWTTPKKGRRSGPRERVHYGSLDVEDLGRVYEALLELAPGISAEEMCRLRRAKLEVVVPVAQGEKYRQSEEPCEATEEPEEDDNIEDEGEETTSGKKTSVKWIERIAPGQFYLRVGLGRKSSGSYYTPHSFVRFLVQETLGPQAAERCPEDDPKPAEILKLKVLDPAMGSGHFLVEACRFLGERLYEACRLCDEKAIAADKAAEKAAGKNQEEAFDAAVADAEKWRQRLLELPDPDEEILRYLPSRAPEGEESGYSQKKAFALCRRLVAVHCLYGVDKNPLAVELAKLSLWLESHAEGLPLTFLDHRFIVGDSLTGPFWKRLIEKPSKGKEREHLEDIFTRGLTVKFKERLSDALKVVRELEATVGKTISDIEEKRRLKEKLDEALLPFKVLAAAWSGGVMLGPDESDDAAYARLLKTICDTGQLPSKIESDVLREMITLGLGVDSAPADGKALAWLASSAQCVPAISYDLTFPEVFYPDGQPDNRLGFDAVLGNPPWNKIQPKAREFFASYDFDILAAPTKKERIAVEQRLEKDQDVIVARSAYEEAIEREHRIHDALYLWQVVSAYGRLTGGDPDDYKFFLERNSQLLHPTGTTGVVVPSAFHANQGATGIRRLYFEEMRLRCCYSFVNGRQLFEIHRSFRYPLIVATRTGPTSNFSCAFYLHDDEWLFGEREDRELNYTFDFVRRTGGEYLTLLELTCGMDLSIARQCLNNGETLREVCRTLGILLRREMDMTNDAHRFLPTSEVIAEHEDPRIPDISHRLLSAGYLILHEGKTFRQYTDLWGDAPQYLVPMCNLVSKTAVLDHAPYYRLSHRIIAGTGDENVTIWSFQPPGCAHGNSCYVETSLHRANSCSLWLLSILNSWTLDFLLTLRVRANLLAFIRDAQPVPDPSNKTFLTHLALRLTCNHAGYARLWKEQVGDEWREDRARFDWPVLEGDDARWEVRSSIDAVVADAYGLSREQYEHALATFNHNSYPRAPELCLAKFDELKSIGLDAFSKKHDPYWDIPLNENLPEPDPDVSAAIKRALESSEADTKASKKLFED